MSNTFWKTVKDSFEKSNSSYMCADSPEFRKVWETSKAGVKVLAREFLEAEPHE